MAMDVVAVSGLPEVVRTTLGGGKDGATVVAVVVFSARETIDSVGDDVVGVHGVTVITVVVSIRIVIEQSVADIASVEITDNDDDVDDDDDDDNDDVVVVDALLATTSLHVSSFKDLTSDTAKVGCVSGHSTGIKKIKFIRSSDNSVQLPRKACNRKTIYMYIYVCKADRFKSGRMITCRLCSPRECKYRFLRFRLTF